MRIYIEDCLGRSRIPIKVNTSTKIRTVKELLEDIFCFTPSLDLHLFVLDGWKKMDPEMCIRDYGLKEDDVVCATTLSMETANYRKSLQENTFVRLRTVQDKLFFRVPSVTN